MVRAFLIAVISSMLFSACNSFLPTQPSPITNSGFSALPDWSPCVVVHTPGRMGDPTFENQWAEIDKLQRAGRITRIRMNTFYDGGASDYFTRARARGLRIFGIISLDQLETYGWENTFDRIYQTYPANIWEIAGEISNGDPYVNPLGTTTPEVFMPKYRRLYEHVRRNYPNAVLTSPPTFGSGSSGVLELERFIQLGLLDMDVIITLNIYTEHAFARYSDVFSRYGGQLSQKRIWITETGGYGPENQIDWVENFYPRMVVTFNPEMICYYALWAGDQPGGDNPFGLITNVENGQPLVERPLFKALTEGR